MSPSARLAALEDLPHVVAVAAAAFQDDPVMSWVFQDAATRPARLRGLFSMPAGDMLRGNGEVHVCDDASVALWRDPAFEHGGLRESDDDSTGEAIADFTDGELERLMVLGATLAANHPHEPHWFLNVLGTVPDRQGQGLGALVIAPVLQRCDADGVRAYLDSTNPRNRPFYRRLGFVDSGEIPLAGGPSLMAMWRDPR
jgi:GNAT superfamily N-acetyltransferase